MNNKIVGQGSYGCVIKPALKCETRNKNITKKDYNNKVSKIMFYSDAKDEFKELNYISKFDGINKYTVSLPKLCQPELNDNFDKIVKQCKDPPTKNVHYVFRKNKTLLSQLLLEDGGLDLNAASAAIFNNKNIKDVELKIFYTSLLNLFDGLIFFNKNKVIHFDIKLINLVYNLDTGISKYIDFGLMKTHEKVIREYKDNTGSYAFSHFNWPPENKFGLKSVFEQEDSASSPRFKDNVKYLRDHFKTHEKFLEKLVNTFDSWGLCTALIHIFKLAVIKDLKNRNFIVKVLELLLQFSEKDITKRNDNLNELSSEYYILLKSFNIYTTKKQNVTSKKNDNNNNDNNNNNINSNIKLQFNNIKNSNIDNSILKSKCKTINKDFNSLTKRCLKKCGIGFERNEKYKCIKIKKINSKSKKNIIRKSPEKKKECSKKNKEYNPITKRCNNKCKENQIRDNKFKCVLKNKTLKRK